MCWYTPLDMTFGDVELLLLATALAVFSLAITTKRQKLCHYPPTTSDVRTVHTMRTLITNQG